MTVTVPYEARCAADCIYLKGSRDIS